MPSSEILCGAEPATPPALPSELSVALIANEELTGMPSWLIPVIAAHMNHLNSS